MTPEQLQQKIDRALRDGYLSRVEREDIIAGVCSSGEITPEICALWRELQEKVYRGEIKLDSY